MRIAIITDAWHPQINGVVTTIEHTCGELERLGHQVELITPDHFTTIPCPTYPSIRLVVGGFNQFTTRLDAFKPQHIHIATEGPLGLLGRHHCQKRNLAFTTSFHTLFAEYLNLRIKLPLSWGYALLRWFHAPSRQIMVASPSIEKILTARGFRNKLARWSRGVDTELFRPQKQSLLTGPKPILIYIGRVAVEKNIEAFLSLNVAGTKVVVGDGPQLAELKTKYPTVQFTGFKTGKPLAELLASADVFVFPSRTDTFGIVMLEALSCGVPVAAYPVMGPLDVITNEKVGRLHENLTEAVNEALSLKPEDCRNHALHYSWLHCTHQFLQNLVPVDSGSQQTEKLSTYPKHSAK